MANDFTLADDLDCCPTMGSQRKVRVVPEDLCRRIVEALRAEEGRE